MIKNINIMEIVKDDRKYQLILPEMAPASEVLQILSEMFGDVSKLIENQMKLQAEAIKPQDNLEQEKVG